jgi:hypothetical protein
MRLNKFWYMNDKFITGRSSLKLTARTVSSLNSVKLISHASDNILRRLWSDKRHTRVILRTASYNSKWTNHRAFAFVHFHYWSNNEATLGYSENDQQSTDQFNIYTSDSRIIAKPFIYFFLQFSLACKQPLFCQSTGTNWPDPTSRTDAHAATLIDEPVSLVCSLLQGCAVHPVGR